MSHVILKCDLRASNDSRVQCTQPSYHTQDLQNSKGTCWNTSGPVDKHFFFY